MSCPKFLIGADIAAPSNGQANVSAWANSQFALGLAQPRTVGLSILRPVRMRRKV